MEEVSESFEVKVGKVDGHSADNCFVLFFCSQDGSVVEGGQAGGGCWGIQVIAVGAAQGAARRLGRNPERTSECWDEDPGEDLQEGRQETSM